MLGSGESGERQRERGNGTCCGRRSLYIVTVVIVYIVMFKKLNRGSALKIIRRMLKTSRNSINWLQQYEFIYLVLFSFFSCKAKFSLFFFFQIQVQLIFFFKFKFNYTFFKFKFS